MAVETFISRIAYLGQVNDIALLNIITESLQFLCCKLGHKVRQTIVRSLFLKKNLKNRF